MIKYRIDADLSALLLSRVRLLTVCKYFTLYLMHTVDLSIGR